MNNTFRSQTILVTGATGLVGKQVTQQLIQRGHRVWVLTRNPEKAKNHFAKGAEIYLGDLNVGVLENLPAVNSVIHLAGENVGAGRWTVERKKRILHSRREGSFNLLKSFTNLAQAPSLISASAIGFYGDRGNEILTESSSCGSDFLAQVCAQWEAAVLNSAVKLARTVVLRTGLVLSSKGGALKKMIGPARLGLNGVLGGGNHWMSWIHLEDLVRMYISAVEDPKWQGVYNAVAPEPVTNRIWTEELNRAVGSRNGPPIPAWTLKLILGEMASLLLSSQRVKSERIENFEFQFSNLPEALRDCCQAFNALEANSK